MTLPHAANSGRHPYADRGLDLYGTPPEAVRALLLAEKLPHRVWEPAAGRGNIVSVLRNAGHAVIAGDIADYGFRLHYRRDFLLERKMPAGCEVIISNPPYRYADQFVGHALELAPLVVMLLRLSFLESKRRTTILESGQLARVHVFRNRLPMMHRDGWAGPRASSAIAFAWFVWSRDHSGPTVIDRITAHTEAAAIRAKRAVDDRQMLLSDFGFFDPTTTEDERLDPHTESPPPRLATERRRAK